MTFRQSVTINEAEMGGITIPISTVLFLENVDTLNSRVCDPADMHIEYIVPTKALEE